MSKVKWEYKVTSVTFQRACMNCRPALAEAGSTFSQRNSVRWQDLTNKRLQEQISP